jgi:hypothetical protein
MSLSLSLSQSCQIEQSQTLREYIFVIFPLRLISTATAI